PFIAFTDYAVYLDEEAMALVRPHKPLDRRKIKDDKEARPYIQELQLNVEHTEKGGYDHSMLNEIYDQPEAIKGTFRGRLYSEKGMIRMAGIEDNLNKLLNAKRIIIVACGTSWHAGLVAEYMIEEFARIPVEVEYASEFRYRNPIINADDVV